MHANKSGNGVDGHVSSALETAGASLTIGPRWLYPGKAAMTRLRSFAWLARAHSPVTDDAIRILLYHRVSDDSDELAVRTSRFRRQMEYLASTGFRVVDVPEAVRLLESGDPLAHTVALSFDDGFRDVVENALPVLVEHGFRATVFLATAVTDGRASFSWYERQPPLLNWGEIVALDRRGTLSFEAHSLTHPNLLRLGEEAARREIFGSRKELEKRLGRAGTIFCYPAGLFSERERSLAEEAGFTAAVSCEPGMNTASTDRFALHRIQIDRRDRLIDFRAKLLGGHDSPLPLRSLYRRLRYRLPRDGVDTPPAATLRQRP
jgi:peptidoglycan/xylan/chitin deacetylase (PgdA/CDA1 family)